MLQQNRSFIHAERLIAGERKINILRILFYIDVFDIDEIVLDISCYRETDNVPKVMRQSRKR